MDSPNFHEKDPLDESRPGSSAAFGYAQSYPSDRFLTPGPSDTSPLRSTTVTRTYRSRTCIPQSKAGRRWLFWGVPIGLVIAAGIAVGVVLGVTKHPKSSSGSSGSSSDSSSSSSGQSGVTSGTTAGDNSSTVETTAASGQSGSTVTTDLGVQFTYQNDFGGSWAIDPENPYSVSFLDASDDVELTHRYPDKPRAGRLDSTKPGPMGLTLFAVLTSVVGLSLSVRTSISMRWFG